MKNIKKFILPLFLLIGSSQYTFTSEIVDIGTDSPVTRNHDTSDDNSRELHDASDDNSRELINIERYPITQQELFSKISNNTTKTKVNAEKLVQQNYKTDSMKYDILLLMNKKPFMEVNVTTGSIENLPTINDVLSKTYNNINKAIIINGLKSTLKAINGAIADDSYDNKSIFSESLKTELNKMKLQIEIRFREVNPTPWLKSYIGLGSVAGIATIAGIYYSGLTTDKQNDYIAELGKGMIKSINTGLSSATQSAKSIINSAKPITSS